MCFIWLFIAITLFFIFDGCLLVVIFYALDLSAVREQVLEEEIINKYY
jgi:hypothetical protein